MSVQNRGADESALEDLLSRPTPPVVEAMAALDGDIVILGAGGKMGPSLARLAARASREAGVRRRVIAVARFTERRLRGWLERAGVDALECDLFERELVARLPDAKNVVFMAGQKFGTTSDGPGTWAVNTVLPAVAAERFPRARIVAFSTGNVYPLTPAGGPGPSESDDVSPVGEYAQSALARERVLEFYSRRQDTPMAILRLNYAVEPRYGVLPDIADRVRSGEPVDLTMGWVNVIWQPDANAIALRSFAHAAVPPFVLNVTGRPALSTRAIAERFAERWGVEPRFTGQEADTALLSDASRCEVLFGAPETQLREMVEHVASWIEQGGRSLGKPTKYEMREGKF